MSNISKRNSRVNKTRKVQTLLKCTECGQMFPIWRLRSRQKEFGHVKTMWCPCCGRKMDFMEIKKEQRTLSGELISSLY